MFVLVRTEKTPTSVNYNEIKQKLEDIFKVYLRRGMSVQHAAITANLNMCKHCGLAFYYGEIHQKLENGVFPMKEEVESICLKDDASFKKIVKQEQARRYQNKQRPKEKLVVAIERWKAMQILEKLRETIMPQQEYSMHIRKQGLTFPPEVCSQLGFYEGQEVKLWIIDGKDVVLVPQEST